MYLKPMLTFVASRRTRGASSVKQQPQPVRSTQSKPDLSECGLVAGIGRAKSQVMPVTCSRAAAVDGSDIGRRRRSCENVYVKRLNQGTRPLDTLIFFMFPFPFLDDL